jgi:phage antirepressor YoqD-like protein
MSEVISKTFAYHGTGITFARRGEITMINATQMAKRFGKRPVDWIKTDSSKRFISTLSEVKKITSSDLVRVTHGDNGSTWMQEDVALEFSRWLSPEFAIWCNDRIKELLQYGITATDTTIDSILADPDNAIRLLQTLKEERQQRQLAESKAALLEEVTREQAPKVLFAEAITGSQTNILVRDLAKLIQQNGYNIGEKRLFQWLRDNGYLCTSGQNYNKPMQRYVEQGLFFIKEGSHSENGVLKSNFTTLVTGKGQQYFINKFIQN